MGEIIIKFSGRNFLENENGDFNFIIKVECREEKRIDYRWWIGFKLGWR